MFLYFNKRVLKPKQTSLQHSPIHTIFEWQQKNPLKTIAPVSMRGKKIRIELRKSNSQHWKEGMD